MGRTKNGVKIYEFRVEGQIDSKWSEWLEGLNICCEVDAETGLSITVLTGPVVDQSALHSVLEKISSLNLKLLSVNQVRSKT
jgi:wyosine [tRNA(Phe)-imidazoG37] synthetase (radical SAM superfamily)